VYAPVVIASFGSGSTRIEIRVIAPDGAAAYRTGFAADVLARKASAVALLRNRRFTVSVAARRELLAGQVDSRLLSAIAFLVHQGPVDIVDFASFAPGAGPGVPLRFADLAETGPAVRPGGAGYVRSLLAVLRSDTSLYRPASVATVHLPGEQAVLRIGFDAPSPLGLLGSAGH
jgi:hypothetical protein